MLVARPRGCHRLCVVVAAGLGFAPPARAVDLTAAVNVNNRTGPRVPLDFIGMSMEYTSVLDWYGAPESPYRAFEKLLRNHGTGIMRFGGNSQDTGCWRAVVKPCNYGITPARLGVIGGIGGVGLEGADRHQPGPVRRGRRALRRGAQHGRLHQERGPSGLLGSAQAAAPRLWIGNEPNRYATNGFRTRYEPPVHAADFLRQVATIRRDLDPAVRGVAVSGPAYATQSSWGTYIGAFLDPARSGGVAFATDHYYATSTCNGGRPTIEQLLSREVAATADREIRESVLAAASRGKTLRMEETNSAACRGQPGVSDVMASAIWGLDYMFRAASAGATGVGFHIASGGTRGRYAYYNAINARPANTTNGYVTDAKPLYYATRMFGRSAKAAD